MVPEGRRVLDYHGKGAWQQTDRQTNSQTGRQGAEAVAESLHFEITAIRQRERERES